MFCFFWPRGMWDLSSPTRHGTCTLCIGRQCLKQWTSREIPVWAFPSPPSVPRAAFLSSVPHGPSFWWSRCKPLIKFQTSVNLYELEKDSNCLYLKKKKNCLYLDLCSDSGTTCRSSANQCSRKWQPWRPPTRASVKELRIFLFSWSWIRISIAPVASGCYIE